MKSSNKLVFLLIFALATVCGGVGSSDAAPKKLVSIAVTPTNPSIVLGTTEQFTATGTYSDNSTRNLTTLVTWSSSAKSVATISNAGRSKGKATSVAAGTTTITARSRGISGSTALTVTVLVSIAVYPTNPSVTLGTTEQFTAIGTYSDNSTQDMTTSVTWRSSTSSVATISNAVGTKGKATSVAAGKTTIMAMATSISGSTILTVTGGGGGTNNVLSITVNGSLCSTNSSYINKPCVSVTVCTPGTSTCQAIDDVLLDTGSYGLRLFKQVLSVSLVQATGNPGSLAECVQFGDGSSEWGPVQIASVILGNEPAVQVPIQVVDSTFGTAPSSCKNADQSPADAGFNGILGVGPFAQDCGSTCSNSAGNGMYYGCNGATCSGTAVPLSDQVQNPVTLLPQDNNGVIIQLPSVPEGGLPSVNGSLMLGIGTQSNNVPSVVTTYTLDQYGEFITTFNSHLYSSFIDTGSNGLFFPSSRMLPNCKDYSDWFCPSSTTSLSSTITGASGSPSGLVSFLISNFDSLISSPNNVFVDIGGNWVGGFDWGLPFFFGRVTYIGLEGSASSLGNGPYFAY